MKLRDALITQAPSLALQRAAADEIARLDALVAQLSAQRQQPGQPTQAAGGTCCGMPATCEVPCFHRPGGAS